jgi:hypothetical protein
MSHLWDVASKRYKRRVQEHGRKRGRVLEGEKPWTFRINVPINVDGEKKEITLGQNSARQLTAAGNEPTDRRFESMLTVDNCDQLY